jgi:L-iditol 2-dehydrogenase
MHAIVYNGVKNVELKDVKKPEVKDNSVIVKIHACAICGTDVKAYEFGIASIKPPVILGHEFTGEIHEIGKFVNDFEPGDRVTMATTIPCGKCSMCRRTLFNMCMDKLPVGTYINGAFAEYLEVPFRGIEHGSLMKLPDELSYDDGSVCEPLGCVLNGQNIANVGFPDIVAVIGGGPIGLLHAEAAKARGAVKTILIEQSRKRCEMAKDFKIDKVVCSEDEDPAAVVMESTSGMGADVVINVAPVIEAIKLAFRLVSKGGRISLFASVPKDNPYVEIDANLIHYGQISVYGASDSTPENHSDAMKLLSTGKISTESLITHTFKLEDFYKGIEAIKNREALKVIIKP